MSQTTVTITEELKTHLETIRDARNENSLNDTIQSIIDTPVKSHRKISDTELTENRAPVKISEYTHEWLKQTKENSEHGAFEDLLRELSGASPRDHGEQPIEWGPL